MSRFGVSVVLIVLIALTGCQSGPPSWQTAVTTAELAQASLDFSWQNVVPLAKREKLDRVWRVDENVYCLTNTNRVFVFDAVTGVRRWSEELGSPAEEVFAPTHVDQATLPTSIGVQRAVRGVPASVDVYDLVIFNTVSYALVFDRTNGKLLHRIDFSRAKFAANTASASDGARIYVGSILGQFQALELDTGLAIYKGSTKAIISATPVYMGGALYVASQDGTIYSARVGSDSAQKLWPFPPAPQATGAFTADITVNEQGVFAGNADYSVYALDPVTGKVVWRFRCGGPIRTAVQVGQTNVYAKAAGDKFYAIDLATGQRAKWTVDNGEMVLAEIGPTAYVLNDETELMAVDAALGTIDSIVPLTGLDLFVPNTSAEAIYAASRNGRLCRLVPRNPRR